VSPTEAIEKPWLFKALFRGGPLDRAVVEKVLAATRGESLASWWHPDFSGRGYENASAGGGASAINMQKHLALAADTDVRVRVLDAGGPLFTAPKVRRPTLESWREEHPNEVQAGLAPRMFRGPLVIARKVPRAVDQNSGGLAMWARRDVVYSQSFLGFSAAWHSDPVSLSRYLLVWLNSSVLRHFLLMCSADWGVERGTLLVDDLRSLPVPRPESLSAAAREAFNTCADAMIAADRVDVARCDQLVADVFGLSSADLECVRDTLAMASPSRASALAAQRSPDLLQVESFRARVEEILAPLLAYSGRTLRVRVEPQEVSAPWLVLGVTTSTDVAVPPRGILEEALHLALVEGASRVVFAGGPTSGTVAVGVFRQARYWTLTQARALALALLGDAAAMETLRGAP
jgi:hypothetical protein